jgi:cell division topological specificity factor
MWQGFKSWFVGKPSSQVAKGRLHLVLAHDRTGLDGGRLQELRQDIAAVLSKYVPIDADGVEIEIETHKRATQLKMSTSIQPRNV